MEPVILRPFTVNDLPILKKWLYQDYILKWFEHPESWLGETENKNGEFDFIHHFIVMYGGIPIGFCQYYDCYFAQEEWYEITSPGVTFSIDYLIGEPGCLRMGLGKAIIGELGRMVLEDAHGVEIIVQPDTKNKASCGVLEAAGYRFCEKQGYYYKELAAPSA